MKEISKATLKKAVRVAYKEGRDWAKVKFGNTFMIMLNTDNGDIWADCDLPNNCRVYKQKSIMPINVYAHWATVAECEAAYLDDAIYELTSAGWTVTD